MILDTIETLDIEEDMTKNNPNKEGDKKQKKQE